MRRRRWTAAVLAVYCSVSLAAGENGIGIKGLGYEKVFAAETVTEQEKMPVKAVEADNGSTPGTEEDVKGDSGQQTVPPKVHLGIDTIHTYESMNGPFSKGYVPVIEGDVVHLAVPYTASGELKSLTVELELKEKTPIVYASYRKTVEKKIYDFDGEQAETYLYLCDINLEKDRMNGKYPVTVKATGYTKQGEAVTLESQLFITITDGTDPKQEENKEKEEEKKEEERQEPDPEGTEDIQDPAGFSGEEPVAGGGGEIFSTGEPEEEIVHQPKLVMESNSLSKDQLEAGEEKEFTVVFKNKSKDKKICNLKVTAKPAEDSVILDKNSFYYDSVAPQGSIEVTAAAAVSPGAEQKKVPVEFTFEYENDKGTAYTGAEQMILDVYQPVSVSLEGFDLPGKVFSLENVNAGMQVRNLGRAPVYNVQVQLEGTGLFPMETFFAGNMDAGASMDGTMRVYVGTKTMKKAGEETEAENDGEEQYGSVIGKLKLTYEDAFGKLYTQEQEFSTVIQKPQITELKVEKEKKETNQWWIAVFILVILIFAGTLGIMAWKVKKSKDQLADFLAGREEQSGS